MTKLELRIEALKLAVQAKCALNEKRNYPLATDCFTEKGKE